MHSAMMGTAAANSAVFFLGSVPSVSKTRQPSSNPRNKRASPRKVSEERPGSTRQNGHRLNLEVSPHRDVSAVRLMRIELGRAYADLLNERGKGSGDNEMGFVERTLGFRTGQLDDQDLRLILRIGFYEIIKLNMPLYAVVDENVRLAKFALIPGAGNMVNGILRKLVLCLFQLGEARG